MNRPEKIDRIFNLHEYIRITVLKDEQVPFLWQHVEVTFHQCSSMKFKIAEYIPLISALDTIHKSFEGALLGKLELTSDIKSDIGFLWNEHLNDDHNQYSWVGLPYILFSTPCGPTTWLYTRKNIIYFEITPTYSWDAQFHKRSRKPLPYKIFMRNYRPYFKTIITSHVAQRLIDKTKSLSINLKKEYMVI